MVDCGAYKLGIALFEYLLQVPVIGSLRDLFSSSWCFTFYLLTYVYVIARTVKNFQTTPVKVDLQVEIQMRVCQ
jgi:hypothetical protein